MTVGQGESNTARFRTPNFTVAIALIFERHKAFLQIVRRTAEKMRRQERFCPDKQDFLLAGKPKSAGILPYFER